MGKIVDGVELLRMIRDGEIKNNTKIKNNDDIYVYDENIGGFFSSIGNGSMVGLYTTKELVSTKFKILSEEDEEIDIDIDIDIDSIEEVKHIYIYNLPPNVESVDDRVTINEEKINQLIKAVKQLYKMTKEEK